MRPLTKQGAAAPWARHLAVYAARVARLLFLRSHCAPGHPVLSAEESLVDMARSKFQEAVLGSCGTGGLAAARSAMEKALRHEVAIQLSRHAEGPDVLESLRGSAALLSHDALFLAPN